MGNFKTLAVKPTIQSLHPFSAGDLLFDWTAFDIPNGAAELTGVSGTILGTNGASQGGELFNLFFARAIDGAVPPSLGTLNDAVAATTSILSKKHIIGFRAIDFGESADAVLDSMASYNCFGTNYSTTTTPHQQGTVLEGETFAPQTNPGYQRIYVAGVAESSIDFGTSVFVAGGAHSEDDLTIVVDNGSGGASNSTKVFQVGDVIHCADNDGGNPVSTTMTVSAVTTTLVTVSGATCPALAENQELGPVNPIELKFDLKY